MDESESIPEVQAAIDLTSIPPGGYNPNETHVFRPFLRGPHFTPFRTEPHFGPKKVRV